MGGALKLRAPPLSLSLSAAWPIYAAFPAASAWTSEVFSALPPMAQSPLSNSLTRTQVTARMFSPSTSIIAAVTLAISSCFCLGVKTSLITSMVTRGMLFLRGVLILRPESCGGRNHSAAGMELSTPLPAMLEGRMQMAWRFLGDCEAVIYPVPHDLPIRPLRAGYGQNRAARSG